MINRSVERDVYLFVLTFGYWHFTSRSEEEACLLFSISFVQWSILVSAMDFVLSVVQRVPHVKVRHLHGLLMAFSYLSVWFYHVWCWYPALNPFSVVFHLFVTDSMKVRRLHCSTPHHVQLHWHSLLFIVFRLRSVYSFFFLHCWWDESIVVSWSSSNETLDDQSEIVQWKTSEISKWILGFENSHGH